MKKFPAINKTIQISKLDNEKHIVYGIVYAPYDFEKREGEVDTEGDAAALEVIEAAAYEFMQKTKTDQVDLKHDEDPDEGFVAESWIVKQGDPTFTEENEVGAWAVGIKVTNETTWKAVKKGEITGLSMGGKALAEELNKGVMMKLSPEGEKSIVKQVLDGLSKAWAELKIVADVPAEPGAVPSVRDQIESVFKDQETFKAVDSPEKATPVLAVLDDVGGVFAEVGRELLKQYIPADTAAMDSVALSSSDSAALGSETSDLAKSVSGSVLESVKPLIEGLDTRLKKIEDAPIGSFQVLPDGEPDASINKDGHRVVQLVRRRTG